MRPQQKFFLFIFSFLYLLILGLDIWLNTLPTHTTMWNYLRTAIFGNFFLIGGVAAVIGALGLGSQSDLVKMMTYLGFSLIAYWGSNTTWAVFSIVTQESNPNNTIINVFFVFLYLFVMIGLWYLFRALRNYITMRVFLYLFIILLTSFSVIIGLFMLPFLSRNAPFTLIVSNSYFLIGDVIIFSILGAILHIGKTHKSLYLIIFGLFIVVVGDIFFAYRNALNIYWQGDISDTLYTTGIFFSSIGLIELYYNHAKENLFNRN